MLASEPPSEIKGDTEMEAGQGEEARGQEGSGDGRPLSEMTGCLDRLSFAWTILKALSSDTELHNDPSWGWREIVDWKKESPFPLDPSKRHLENQQTKSEAREKAN